MGTHPVSDEVGQVSKEGSGIMAGIVGLHAYNSAKNDIPADVPFYALIAAAVSRADTYNLDALDRAFPGVVDEVRARYNAPGGVLDGD